SNDDDDDDEIKLADPTELVKEIGDAAEAMDLHSPEDDQPLQIFSKDDANIKYDLEPQSQKFKLEKDKVVIEADLLKAQPSYPNVQQLIELLVNSLKPELAKILIDHDFMGDLKKYIEKLEIEVPGDLKELLGKLEDSQLTKHKVLDALPILLDRVVASLDRFAKAIDSASQKADDRSVPSASQAGTHPAEGEKNTR
ncbi:hypothetical protein Tco_0444606, partial [Tanacetum coccineum]